MSYLIKNNQLIATSNISLKSGRIVNAAWSVCNEELNANRDQNLVNSFDVKISNAAKWKREAALNETFAVMVNEGEFLLS